MGYCKEVQMIDYFEPAKKICSYEGIDWDLEHAIIEYQQECKEERDNEKIRCT